jgi:3-oxoacyl-[acyl-carrier protein] reductase
MLQVDLKGRTALVTGSSTGIGRAIALAFARNGADIAVHYRRNKDAAAEVANLARDEGRKAIAVRADVAQKSEVEGLFAEVEDAFGQRLDILVNNAGSLVKRASVADMDEDTFDRIVGVNFRSVFLCSQAAIPKLPDETGRIVNVSSIAARNGGGPGAATYAASKAAVSCFTKNLARELAPRGITVNAIAPGVVETPFHEEFTTAEVMEAFRQRTPLARNGVPDDIAGAVLYLVSPEAAWTTGETIEVNGGMLMD